ncbi:YdcH family protein [Thermomonas alba]|uniref:YdcH family protein n=1 Tax=Thermomonas alba TaxID=2888525 RepID=UPI001F03CA4A|nr:YdcH family protein [Thermomonas alba]
MNQPLDPAELARLTRRLAELRLEHRALDEEIALLQASLQADELALKRMKKRKLLLKDQIAWIENRLIPDEPA